MLPVGPQIMTTPKMLFKIATKLEIGRMEETYELAPQNTTAEIKDDDDDVCF